MLTSKFGELNGKRYVDGEVMLMRIPPALLCNEMTHQAVEDVSHKPLARNFTLLALEHSIHRNGQMVFKSDQKALQSVKALLPEVVQAYRPCGTSFPLPKL